MNTFSPVTLESHFNKMNTRFNSSNLSCSIAVSRREREREQPAAETDNRVEGRRWNIHAVRLCLHRKFVISPQSFDSSMCLFANGFTRRQREPMSSSVWRTWASDTDWWEGEVRSRQQIWISHSWNIHTYCIHECVDRHVLCKELSFLFEVNTFIQQECIILINNNSKTKKRKIYISNKWCSFDLSIYQSPEKILSRTTVFNIVNNKKILMYQKLKLKLVHFVQSHFFICLLNRHTVNI